MYNNLQSLKTYTHSSTSNNKGTTFLRSEKDVDLVVLIKSISAKCLLHTKLIC